MTAPKGALMMLVHIDVSEVRALLTAAEPLLRVK